jgi:hypothetical protein
MDITTTNTLCYAVIVDYDILLDYDSFTSIGGVDFVSKKLLFILFCTLLLLMTTFGMTAQQDGCNIDFVPLETAMANAQSAAGQGNTGAALGYLTEIRTIIEGIEETCGGGLNWCYPGQRWGDGRCNEPGLSQDEVNWFWACGTYWAEYENGLSDSVPAWCGFAEDSDGDGTPDDEDLCPADSSKIAPGTCGCGSSDGDIDGDGMADCNDQCPLDPSKVTPGVCGCFIPETGDSDGDGIADCNDPCANYANLSCTTSWCQDAFVPGSGFPIYSPPRVLVEYFPSNPGLRPCS